MDNLNSDQLVQVLSDYVTVDQQSTFSVAYSGGIDSTVLLHLLHDARKKHGFTLIALHCNHDIQPQSGSWQRQCKNFCQQLEINFYATRLDLFSKGVKFSEDAARNQRYAWFQTQIEENGILLTAHHQHDQAETFILNLMRGSGARGLSSIQVCQRFGEGLLIRPLLHFSKNQIEEYAGNAKIPFIEDPANLDLSFDRNYVRHTVIASLKERWPSAVVQISRSATYLSETRRTLSEIALADAQVCSTEGKNFYCLGYQLNADLLKGLEKFRRINLIRYWVRRHALPEPGRKSLQSLCEALEQNRTNYWEMTWSGGRIFLYQRKLYLTGSSLNQPLTEKIKWNLRAPLLIESLGINLIPYHSKSRGLHSKFSGSDFYIQFRQGGERIQLPGRSHTSSLKKVFQQHLIPPWERNSLPLLYCGDELAAVLPWFEAEKYCTPKGEKGISVRIEVATTA